MIARGCFSSDGNVTNVLGDYTKTNVTDDPLCQQTLLAMISLLFALWARFI